MQCLEDRGLKSGMLGLESLQVLFLNLSCLMPPNNSTGFIRLWLDFFCKVYICKVYNTEPGMLGEHSECNLVIISSVILTHYLYIIKSCILEGDWWGRKSWC